jgi:hypothetical protein
MVYVRTLLFAFVFCLASQIFAQATPPAPVDQAMVEKQFGSEFTLLSDFTPITGDLDNDGVEDIVIPARARGALIGEAEFNYKTIDPYTSFFGLGDPKITSTFATEDPKYRGFVLLIIHGAGPDAWRSEKPRAKFVIINLPFKKVAMKRILLKKKKINAIYAEETGGDEMTSAVFFDGKNYKYQPMGASMQ